LAARLLSDADPDLAIVVFTEIHHASHVLWHTLSSEYPPPPGPSLIDLYATVDREIARLVEVVGSDGSVVVFALHGMRATRGIPTLLPGLLRGEGYAQPATWSTQSWPERALSAFGAAKRRSPAWARALYNAGVGHSLRVGLARPTMLDPLDWPRTRAFSLPTDQHGWLRVNLQGRERRGTVSGGEYGSLCDRLEARLRALSTADGRPIVAEVLRTATDGRDAVGNPLPDMVVHWATAAHDDPSQVSNVNLTGQHGSDGFCVTVGPVAAAMADTVKAEDLHAALLSPRLA
jgi:predicted AlkP superfamily phosphohydrolase/phosphomutase